MIELDLSDFLSESDLSVPTEVIEAVLDDLSAAARAKWVRAAQTTLRSSAQTYIQGISEVESDEGQRVITLEGWLPNAIESGVAAWDLRQTVLQGPNVKIGQDGARYQSVPFRHGTPGTTGLVGSPMGMRYGPQGPQSIALVSGGHMSGTEAEKLGETLYKRAKALRDRKRKSGKTTRGRLAAGVGGVRKLAPWHSTDIFAGMQRTRKTSINETTGKKTTQTTGYMTWRTISENSKTGWMHPGIESRNLLDQVQRHVSEIAGALFSQALGGGR